MKVSCVNVKGEAVRREGKTITTKGTLRYTYVKTSNGWVGGSSWKPHKKRKRKRRGRGVDKGRRSELSKERRRRYPNKR